MKHILNILATWRIMELIQTEDAPFDILVIFRDYLHFNYYRHNRQPITIKDKILNELYEAIECKWCLSVWIGFLVALFTGENILLGFAYSAGALFVSWLADSGLQTWLNQVTDGILERK